MDIILLAVFGVVTYCVASEGAWGAALVALSVIFAGLLAMNFFEPLAFFLERTISASTAWSMRWDVICLVGLFVGIVLLLRYCVDRVQPTYIEVHPLLYEGVRWGCGALAGYVTMAFLLTALHTTPLPREFWGFRPEKTNYLGVTAPDRQWLGFTQYVSEKAFYKGRVFDGPHAIIGDYDRIWSSFPIRYATRRQTPGSAAAAGSAIRRPSGGTRKGGGARPTF